MLEILKENKTKGKYFVHWDGTDVNGRAWRNSWIKRECVMTHDIKEEWQKADKERQRYVFFDRHGQLLMQRSTVTCDLIMRKKKI